MIGLRAFTILFLAVMLMVNIASAIPDTDLYKFRASYRGYAYFGANESQNFIINTFRDESSEYYFVLRASTGDSPPYDDFYIRFQCAGDPIWTELHTTDYDSWESAGHISFKKEMVLNETISYDGSSVVRATAWCTVAEIDDLVIDGNTGYSRVFVELVPVLEQNVITVAWFCADALRENVTEQLVAGIGIVVENNVNIFYTVWIVFQILAVLFVVLGIPIMIFLLFRWAIWRVSGHKLFERKSEMYVER